MVTTIGDLLSLAREIEEASRGNQDLDIEIALLAEPYPRRAGLWLGLEFGASGRRYTRSLDAALSLAPSNAPWAVGMEPDPWARVGRHEVRARTAPLALAAAALRARIARLEESDSQLRLPGDVFENRMAS